jgi:sulfur-oxidizing protein SoxY
MAEKSPAVSASSFDVYRISYRKTGVHFSGKCSEVDSGFRKENAPGMIFADRALGQTVTRGKRCLGVTRRTVLATAAGWAAATVVQPSWAGEDEAVGLIEQLTGKAPTQSDRLHLTMPRVFPNGYTVPLTLEIDSPMTKTDHVRLVRVVAPKNPIVEVATFHFAAQRSEARVSTRIRLAGPQDVLAVAEMSDGTLLMTRTFVDVATNGCA